jgi:UPF0271 protein
MTLNHIKPHGSLYGMAARLEHIAEGVCDAADVFKVPLYGIVNSLHETVYPRRGHRFLAEYYADLHYNDEGIMIITREHGAFDPSDVAVRVVRAVKEGRTLSENGNDVRVRADSVCVHSDTPNAVEVAQAVRDVLGPRRAAA